MCAIKLFFQGSQFPNDMRRHGVVESERDGIGGTFLSLVRQVPCVETHRCVRIEGPKSGRKVWVKVVEDDGHVFVGWTSLSVRFVLLVDDVEVTISDRDVQATYKITPGSGYPSSVLQ